LSRTTHSQSVYVWANRDAKQSFRYLGSWLGVNTEIMVA
jgi:hypothetical protein